MKASITKGLSTAEKQKVLLSFKSNRLFLTQLQSLLEAKLEPSTKEDQYDKASWPYYAADQIGYRRAIKEVLNLIQSEE